MSQHEFVVAEQKILGRDGKSYTSVAGYAGGLQVLNPKQCVSPSHCQYPTKLGCPSRPL